MSAALVPVKSLADVKSRLAAALPQDRLEELCLAMLEDVLAALRDARSVDRVAVVTPDPRVGEVAGRCGAQALVGPDPGLNAALERGADELELAAEEPLLVVLGDVAGARADEVELLFGALRDLGGRGVVLAASADGGTSALLRAPSDIIPSRFGPQSAAAHREAARAAHAPWRQLDLPSLALDLDREEDLVHFAQHADAHPNASGVGGARTRALLQGWRARERGAGLRA